MGFRDPAYLQHIQFTVRRWVSQLLQSTGYSVLEAHSGPDAIKVSDKHHGPIDLLISDMVMPGGLTGDELAAILKRVHPTMKVGLMSGYHQNVFVDETRWPLLPKPFQSATLIEQVKHALAEGSLNGNLALPHQAQSEQASAYQNYRHRFGNFSSASASASGQKSRPPTYRE
jgi:DNA-binding NtrC family response regulator